MAALKRAAYFKYKKMEIKNYGYRANYNHKSHNRKYTE